MCGLCGQTIHQERRRRPVGAGPYDTMDTTLDNKTRAFYRRTLRILRDSGIPFLVGGGYALHRYTGIVRHTKDLDLFVRPQDACLVLDVLKADDCRTEMTFPHWLGKVKHGDTYIDI